MKKKINKNVKLTYLLENLLPMKYLFVLARRIIAFVDIVYYDGVAYCQIQYCFCEYVSLLTGRTFFIVAACWMSYCQWLDCVADCETSCCQCQFVVGCRPNYCHWQGAKGDRLTESRRQALASSNTNSVCLQKTLQSKNCRQTLNVHYRLPPATCATTCQSYASASWRRRHGAVLLR